MTRGEPSEHINIEGTDIKYVIYLVSFLIIVSVLGLAEPFSMYVMFIFKTMSSKALKFITYSLFFPIFCEFRVFCSPRFHCITKRKVCAIWKTIYIKTRSVS